MSENYLWHKSTINFTLIWSNKKKEKAMHYRLPVKTRLKRLSVKTFSPKLLEKLQTNNAQLTINFTLIWPNKKKKNNASKLQTVSQNKTKATKILNQAEVKQLC